MSESLDELRDRLAETFAQENRGYDFHRDNVPFAVDLRNCYRAGFDASTKYHAAEREKLLRVVEVLQVAAENNLAFSPGDHITRDALEKADAILNGAKE